MSRENIRASLEDIVFVAIDFEYESKAKKAGISRIYEIGVAVLDTRDLFTKDVGEVIQTENRQQKDRGTRFRFGESKKINLCEMAGYMESHLFRKS